MEPSDAHYPYACGKYDKKFATKGNLHNHSKTHDATRYFCPLDSGKRSYSNTNNLNVIKLYWFRI